MMGKKSKTTVKPKESEQGTSLLIRWRFHLVLGFVFLAFAALVVRLAFIQVIEPDNLIREGDLRFYPCESPSVRARYHLRSQW